MVGSPPGFPLPEAARVQGQTQAISGSTYRLRRGFFGYRRDDVQAALADQRGQLARIASSLDSVWRDRDDVRRQLEDERARFESELEAERQRVAQLERRARLRALHVIGRAEKEASRRQHEAEVLERRASSRIEELLEVRDHLLDDLHAKVAAAADALNGNRDGRSATQATGADRRQPFARRAAMTSLDLDWRFSPSTEGRQSVERVLLGRVARR